MMATAPADVVISQAVSLRSKVAASVGLFRLTRSLDLNVNQVGLRVVEGRCKPIILGGVRRTACLVIKREVRIQIIAVF